MIIKKNNPRQALIQQEGTLMYLSIICMKMILDQVISGE
jgi:hypothetical protein